MSPAAQTAAAALQQPAPRADDGSSLLLDICCTDDDPAFPQHPTPAGAGAAGGVGEKQHLVHEKRVLFFGLCHLSFQVDRWLRVVIYGLSVSLTSCLFAGWQQYSLILLKGGVYSWLCSPASSSSAAAVAVENSEIPGLFTCPHQDKAVNALLPLASGFELAGAVAAGLLLDFAGPRICALTGSTIGFGSYIMLMYSKKTMNLLTLSMATVGIAINLIGFPALTLEDYFPTAAATTAAYVIACQCVSSIISVILWLIWQRHPNLTFHQIWWGYLLIIWIPVSIPYIAMLPYKRHRLVPLATDTTSGVGGGGVTTTTSGGGVKKFDVKELKSFIVSAPYLVMNLLSVILMLQTSYWQLIVRSQLGSKISDFLGYTMPSQAAWALILGRVADVTQTPKMIAFLLFLYTIVYAFVLAGRSWVQYVCVSLFNVAMSYAYTIKYTYVQERFPQMYYGTLVGVTGAVSGCGVIATNILNYLDKPRTASIGLGLITLLGWPMCWWLHKELMNHYRSCSRAAGDEEDVVGGGGGVFGAEAGGGGGGGGVGGFSAESFSVSSKTQPTHHLKHHHVNSFEPILISE